MVLQDTWLFSGTVRENIRYGKPGASEEEVARAAKLAEIYDDIAAMPDGFDTYGRGAGTLLSGGRSREFRLPASF